VGSHESHLRSNFIRLERYLGIHIFLINSRPLNPETDAAVLPDGHSVRYLEPSNIDMIDANPELQLSAANPRSPPIRCPYAY